MSRSCWGHIPWLKHGPALFRLSLPIVSTAVIYQLGGFITLSYVGRIEGSSYMGAVALGGMLCNVTGYSLSYGMCTALDALISQAFGAQEYLQMGLHAQRAMVILTIFSIPVSFVWHQTEWILNHLLGIDAVVSVLAGRWARILIIGLWPNLMFEILKRFLQGQNIVWPAVVAAALRTVSVFLMSEMAMQLGYGFDGLAMASVLANWVSLLVLLCSMVGRKLYLHCSPKSGANHYAHLGTLDPDDEGSPTDAETAVGLKSFLDPELNWPSWSVAVLQDWGAFLHLGVPGALSLFLEWGSFELAASIAGHIPNSSVVLAAHGVYMNTCGLLYMMPNAIASATATVAGNLLGANEPEDAKGVIKIGTIFDFQYGLFAGLLLYTLRHMWGALYTSDLAVQKLVADNMSVMFVYTIVDSTKCVTLNVLRSIGLPQVTVYVNSLSCVFVLLPLGWTLAIRLDYGLFGLWASMSTAWLLATLIFSYILLTTNWKLQADLVRNRNKKGREALRDLFDNNSDGVELSPAVVNVIEMIEMNTTAAAV